VSVSIRSMTIGDYDDVAALWHGAPGVGLSDADSRRGIAQFLERNPGLSLVAHDGDRLVGAVLCGHDGRRGVITHLAVEPARRREGIGRNLVERCIASVGALRIEKCHVFVFAENEEAITFWKEGGWHERVELRLLSRYTT